MLRKNALKYTLLMAVAAVCSLAVHGKGETKIEPAYAWTITDPLGDREEAEIDTLFEDFHLMAVPTAWSTAWATTGNYGAPGQDQIFFNRGEASDFMFEDVIAPWFHTVDTHKFYNSRVPMTLVTHLTGGNKYSNQDRTMITFSGNAGKRLQIGANMDYVYSKGSYEQQADKNFNWNLGGSYTGDRYELQTFFNHYAFTTKESGGITDDRYITHPADVQGGDTRVDNKSIPTFLTQAESNLQGSHFFMNHRYKVGFYRHERDSLTDTIVSSTYVPVTSFIWTMDWRNGRHRFTNKSASDDAAFFEHTYLSRTGTADTTNYMQLTNTVGIALLEGFNKWAKFGFSAYAYHQLYRQTFPYELEASDTPLAEGLDPVPASVPKKINEHRVYVGANLTKRQGDLLHYNASAELGVAGFIAGDLYLDGDIDTRFKLLGDTVTIRGYGSFMNAYPSSMMYQFASNHYIWDNDFDREVRMRVGGELDLPFINANINVGYETLKNFTYFNNSNLPEQHSGVISVLSATAKHNLEVRALHWDNELTFQTTSNDKVLPLPMFSIYSNLYVKFMVAKVLHVQLGADCNYYTRYYAPAYNPATMTFHTQDELKCGNFALMNVYANFKLKKARFYVAYTHANGQLFGGNNYFASPHYPLNPRRLMIGVSVDFVN